MLKLINETPTGVIDGVNKVFEFDKIIGTVSIANVDGIETLLYSYSNNKITFEVAPITSVEVTYYYSEVNSINGTGEVTLSDLSTLFYRKIGRINDDGTIPKNISKLYPKDYVEEELIKSIKRISNISPEKNRVQQYTINGATGSEVLNTDPVNNSVTFDVEQNTEIAGVVMTGQSVVYNYYSYSNGAYQVADLNVAEQGDKLLLGFRIPYGVKDIVNIVVGNRELDYIHEMDFTIDTLDKFTIIRDWQGNDYIFLPYSETSITAVVKYIPDIHLSMSEDIIDIPDEYSDLFAYDVAYRLLRDREDERWIEFKREVGTGEKEGLLYEYQNYVKSKIKRPRVRVGFAKT